MIQEEQDDVYTAARITKEVDDRIYKAVRITPIVGKLVYATGLGLIAATIWTYSLFRDVGDLKTYITDEKKENYSQRLHDEEVNGKRRNNQIINLNKRVFGFPETPDGGN